MEIAATLVENGEAFACPPQYTCNTLSIVMLLHQSLLLLDGWKVSLVEAGCADHLLAVRDPELHRKATDILVLLLSEGRYNLEIRCVQLPYMVSTTYYHHMVCVGNRILRYM